MAGDFLDRVEIVPGLDFLAAEAVRQQEAEQAGGVDGFHQSERQALVALDRRGALRDERPERARPRERIRANRLIHALPRCAVQGD